MNKDQRWIADAFMNELETVKLADRPPMHITDRRFAICEMVLTELPGDDPEELALRADAEALRDVCFDPTNLDVIHRYLAILGAHVELLKSVRPGLC